MKVIAKKQNYNKQNYNKTIIFSQLEILPLENEIAKLKEFSGCTQK